MKPTVVVVAGNLHSIMVKGTAETDFCGDCPFLKYSKNSFFCTLPSQAGNDLDDCEILGSVGNRHRMYVARCQHCLDSELCHIIVNGRKCTTSSRLFSYRDVVNESGVRGNPTVTYTRAVGGASGVMIEGDFVTVTDGTVFNVTHTDNA